MQCLWARDLHQYQGLRTVHELLRRPVCGGDWGSELRRMRTGLLVACGRGIVRRLPCWDLLNRWAHLYQLCGWHLRGDKRKRHLRRMRAGHRVNTRGHHMLDMSSRQGL